MPGKPYQSCLNPYEDEIFSLRGKRLPTPYSQIAEVLYKKYKLRVCRETIFKFVRARSRIRKMHGSTRHSATRRFKSVRKLIRHTNPDSKQPQKPKFEFKYSERYNLTRLPPDVAAARRKKLEEEGH